jgi:hypothetical protein
MDPPSLPRWKIRSVCLSKFFFPSNQRPGSRGLAPCAVTIEAGEEPAKPGRIILVVLRGTREHGGGGERRRAVKILNDKHDESAQGASLISTVAQTTLSNPS